MQMRENNIILSPDGKLQASFSLDKKNTPVYTAGYSGKPVLKNSQLGLVRSNVSFAENLKLINVSQSKTIKDKYKMLCGKKKLCDYKANQVIFTLQNKIGETIDIIFQVSDDGVAFRYVFPDASQKVFSIEKENTFFAFAADAKSWLHPMQPAKTGWAQTQPSYEEYYEMEKPVGQNSPTGQGWCLPALFKTTDDIWVLICDSDVDENYCACRLADDSTDGVYKIAFPHPMEHRGEIDPVNPQITLPFQSPWRVLIIGDSLKTIIESTLITDVAAPPKIKKNDFIKPGRAAWHWLRYSDNSATVEFAEKFIAFAAEMHWEYVLIDADWDKNIGYEKMAELVKQADKKNIGVILWYNSNGNWNSAPFTPKDKMHEQTVRRNEFAILKKMGVKGVKIDFFGGDKQATMKLYLDILKDAADFGIMVNFHGATIPRGWQRTYPNLVSMEAVRGMEFVTFEQANADKQPQHCCMLPFTRNVIGSMDFTPVVFSPTIRTSQLLTTPAFELALSVIFESAIQHFGLVPDEMKLMPDFVHEFMQKVPTTWDETKFISGFPGKYAVIARRNKDSWYIAGINGQNTEQKINFDLSFLDDNNYNGILISDGQNRTFTKKSLESFDSCDNLLLKPHSGFVIWLNKK
jgi:alpha-glucosidase